MIHFIWSAWSRCSMLAKRLPTHHIAAISIDETWKQQEIHSADKLPENATLVSKQCLVRRIATVSDVALVVGGGNPQPAKFL